MAHSDKKLVTVAVFTNSIEATLAQQRLEDEEIAAFLKDEATVNLAWHFTIAVGGIKLLVLQEQTEQAASILAEANQEDYSALLEEEEEKPTIPRPSTADRLAEQAFRAAVLGLAFLPLQLYSLWLLVRVVFSRRKMRRKGWIEFIAAMGIDSIIITLLWQILKLLKS